MKLGELRSAIRKAKGNPIVKIPIIGGIIITLSLQKTHLLEELERIFPGGKAVETGFDFVEETGLLRGRGIDPETAAAHALAVSEARAENEEIDLLDDGADGLDLIRAQLGETGEGLGVEPDDDDLLV